MARDLWEPGERTPLDAVERRLLPGLERYGRLTISGGEPFDQPDALAELVGRLRRRLDPEVLVYSGRTLAELEADPASRPLLEGADLLVAGPFDERATDVLRWRGSDNQAVHLLSPRAQRYRRLAGRPKPGRPALALQQFGAGRVRLIGIPRRGDLARYHAATAARGFIVQEATLGEG
jgi:anaerobic ribonucleoside-triphosphate reductase activating protein